jgi:hypothetical protein
MHSLKTLVEKSRAEEMELTAGDADDNRFEMAHRVRVIDWVARLWTRDPAPSSGGGIR